MVVLSVVLLVYLMVDELVSMMVDLTDAYMVYCSVVLLVEKWVYSLAVLLVVKSVANLVGWEVEN